jgi:hypothetical protein
VSVFATTFPIDFEKRAPSDGAAGGQPGTQATKVAPLPLPMAFTRTR